MKFVVIDDSILALHQVNHYIKVIFPQAEVIKCSKPEEGLEIVKKYTSEIKFVIVDFNMENMTGIEFIDAILPLLKPNQIALYTANTQSSIQQETMKRGVFFIKKESIKEELTNILKNLTI